MPQPVMAGPPPLRPKTSPTVPVLVISLAVCFVGAVLFGILWSQANGEAEDAQTLATSWRMVTRVRNAMVLARGRGSDQFPRGTLERRSVAGLLGYQTDETDRLLDDYLCTTRHARAVVDRVFWE